jgi:uncharacterized protein YdeI (YjbR/CyaY-like superfamily)
MSKRGDADIARVAPPANSTHPHTRGAWRAWLTRHHERTDGVWLVLWKQASGKASLVYDEAVEEALCFGWIDSKPRALDADRSMLWFAPRKARTGWSRPNKLRIERAIAAAKADGSWSALDAVENLELPDDLATALAAHRGAAANFSNFPRSAKRGILEWIAIAKKPQTRAARILETCIRAASNERANQWRK